MYVNRVAAPLARDVYQFGGALRWLLFRCVPSLVLLSLLLTLFLSLPARAIEDTELDELSSGHMLLSGAGGEYQPALMQESKVHFDISGMIATARLSQTFVNTSREYVEGVYVFPLPENAAVRSLEMQIGERRIVGEVKEKAQAKAIYQQAKQAGKKAVLVEQQRPNLFSNRVANVAPGETIVVQLEYVQRLEYKSGSFSLRFPTTITPRYMPGVPLVSQGGQEERPPLTVQADHGWALPTTEVPDAHAISPLQHPQPGSDTSPHNPIEITARLDMGMPLAAVDSPYHEITLSRRAGVYDIRLAGGQSEMDRDFVLQWRPVSGSAPTAALFTEQVAGDYYGLLMVLPPARQLAPRVIPREIIFVVDTSGSMGGVSIRQARQSLDEALRQLQPQDRFNIIQFNSSFQSLYRQAMPANSHHLQQATEFVRHLSASGGTEMMPALQAALQPPALPDQLREQAMLRQVIFITDGAVGNEAALFEQISSILGSNRLFTVGIGSAPNSWFMRKAAEFGRGTYTYIGNIEEVGEQMSQLFGQLSRPAAVDIKVEWPAGAEVWPRHIPDLYQGQPLLLAVKFGKKPPSGKLAVSGVLSNREWGTQLQLPTGSDPEHATDHAGVASLWARSKIEALLDGKLQGRSEQDVRAAVLPLALRHQLVSPYTSFVAVEQVVSRPPEAGLESEPVLNSRPRGQASQPYAYPRTATTAPARIWIAVFLLFAAVMVSATRQEEAVSAS